MTVAVIVQARMTSSRLPGKVMLPILGRPMLSYEIERLRMARGFDRMVLATTTNRSDDVIADFCAAERIDCYRGSEHDVLGRYHEAALRFDAKVVVRATADCPLLDPEVVERVMAAYFEAGGGCDYASNMITPTFPYGMAVEVMSFEALSQAHANARETQEREHVTPHIYWHPERFRIKSVTMSPDLSRLRWTVDTPEDFDLVTRILQALYPVKPGFRMADVLALLEAHPDWETINRHVGQVAVQSRRSAPE